MCTWISDGCSAVLIPVPTSFEHTQTLISLCFWTSGSRKTAGPQILVSVKYIFYGNCQNYDFATDDSPVSRILFVDSYIVLNINSFIFNIPLCDYRLNTVTSDVRHNTYLLWHVFFSMQWLHVSTNNYVIFRPFNTKHIYKSAHVDVKYLLKRVQRGL
jgi:hypothetical protein